MAIIYCINILTAFPNARKHERFHQCCGCRPIRNCAMRSRDINTRAPFLPEDMPIRLLHLSFRDFLLDTQKRGKSPFWGN